MHLTLRREVLNADGQCDEEETVVKKVLCKSQPATF